MNPWSTVILFFCAVACSVVASNASESDPRSKTYVPDSLAVENKIIRHKEQIRIQKYPQHHKDKSAAQTRISETTDPIIWEDNLAIESEPYLNRVLYHYMERYDITWLHVIPILALIYLAAPFLIYSLTFATVVSGRTVNTATHSLHQLPHILHNSK
jgi:hypothetical protein